MFGALAAVVLAASGADTSTSYEDQLVDWALKLHDREREPSPEGKVIEEVLIASEDVFAPSDPWPMFLNIFHWKTKEPIVRREVLLGPGDTWNKAKIDETERNLRGHVIFAVAKVIPVKGRNGGIALLVVTKDRWSLRAEWSYLIVGTVLEYLDVPITEINFLGRDLQLTIEPNLRRDTFELSESFQAPRIFGTKITVAESASIVLNRATGNPEGTAGLLEAVRPLLTLDQSWAFEVVAEWNVRRVRIFRGADIWQLDIPGAPNGVPYIYDARVLDTWALITKSYGSHWKLNLTGGPAAYIHQYEPPAEETLDPLTRSQYISNWLPHSENATYLYGAAHLYLAEYRTMHDVDTFALTEDVQVGPSVRGGFKWALPLFADVSAYFEVAGSVVWRFVFGDDLLAVSAAAGARFVRTDAPIYNQHYAFEVSNYSPKFEGGRFVVRMLGEYRVNDLDNHQVLLGGGSGLRGAPAESLVGRNEFLANVEYRTRPFVFATVHAGFVLFYDVGAAYGPTRFADALTHTVGIGARILLPQLNTQVIRLDFGWVLGNGAPISPSNFSSTFGQVTQLRPTFFDDPI